MGFLDSQIVESRSAQAVAVAAYSPFSRLALNHEVPLGGEISDAAA
jgi:hypothetical protein